MVRCNIVLQLQKTKIQCNSDLPNLHSEYQGTRSGTGRGVQKWIDSLRVYVKGGHGGNGMPKYGGVGGKGGDVIIKATKCNFEKTLRPTKQGKPEKEKPLKSLYEVFSREFFSDSTRQSLKAGPGEDAHRHKLIGQCGKDKILNVITAIILLFCSFYSANLNFHVGVANGTYTLNLRVMIFYILRFP